MTEATNATIRARIAHLGGVSTLLACVGCGGADSSSVATHNLDGAMVVNPETGLAYEDTRSGSVTQPPQVASGRFEGANVANGGDRYDAVGTNPFVLTAHDPLSTFAADVDTGSYDLFVRDAEAGRLPRPESVRLEEYVNFFTYDYPAADFDADVPFRIDLAASPSLSGSGTTLLRVGIQGKQPPPQQMRPANLVFLVDVWGSMQGSDRIGLVQQVLRQTLDLLRPGDRVSIVSYASDTRVRLPSTEIGERGSIEAQIAQLSAGGSTAGESGLRLAYQQARDGFIEGGINHILLCTDGDFNVGPSSNEALLERIRERRRTGITFTALGFGVGNLNDSLLEAISNAGNGFYGVISSEEQAADYVSERLLSTLSLIARDVKIQVELNPRWVYAYRLLGYENRAIADADFRDDAVDAGEIGAGHRVTALYELALAGVPIPMTPGAPLPEDGEAFGGEREVAAEDLARVKVRSVDVDAAEGSAAREVSTSLPRAAAGGAFAEADADLRWAASIAQFAELLKNSPYASPAALEALSDEFAAQSDRDDDRAHFGALFERIEPLL